MLRIKWWLSCLVMMIIIAFPISAQDTTRTETDTVDTPADTTGTVQDTTDFVPDTLNQGTDLREIHKEYTEISQRLQTVQKQALSDTDIAEKTEQFTNKLEAEMVKQDPSAKSKLERRESIVDEFGQAEQAGNSDKMNKLQVEFQDINNDLQPLQQQALEVEELRQEGKELEEALFNKMVELEPEVPELFARLQVLGAQLQGQDTGTGNQF